jgi:uncharacterized protein (TIGR02147 family)
VPKSEISIYKFVDYRSYFRDYYNQRNKTDRRFSHRFLSDKLGDKSPSFFLKVIQGQRRLTDEQLERIAKLFDLDREETRYLLCMYRYGAAKDNSEREYHLGLMAAISTPSRKELGVETSDFYSDWYHSAVRALLGILDIADDLTPITRRLKPTLSIQQARQSVLLLERLNLIAKNEHGFWKPKENLIVFKSPIQDAKMRAYRLKCLDLAKMAVSAPQLSYPPQFYTTTMTVSEDALDLIRKNLTKFRSEVRTIVSRDNHPQTRVVQLQDVLLSLTDE